MCATHLKKPPPWSVRNHDGQPYSWVAFRNKSATVQVLLFVEQCKKVTNRENPSITSITNPQATRLWWLSRCESLFGPATVYAHHETVIAQRIMTLWRSICIYECALSVYVTPGISNGPKPLKFRLNSHVHSEKHRLPGLFGEPSNKIATCEYLVRLQYSHLGWQSQNISWKFLVIFRTASLSVCDTKRDTFCKAQTAFSRWIVKFSVIATSFIDRCCS